MRKQDRKIKILDLIQQKGFVEVIELAKIFSVSEMSIRNDLNELANEGRVQRVHGGGTRAQRSNLELSLIEKLRLSKAEKEAIGRRAAEVIPDNSTLMLDSGTTTQYVARNLATYSNLIVITNGLNIIDTLAGIDGISLYIVGGQLRSKSYAIIGRDAEEQLGKYNAEYSVFGIDGIDLKVGLTNNNQSDGNITRVQIRQAKHRILVADSSKLGYVGVFPTAKIEDVDTLVTDKQASADYIREIESRGVRVIIAE